MILNTLIFLVLEAAVQLPYRASARSEGGSPGKPEKGLGLSSLLQFLNYLASCLCNAVFQELVALEDHNINVYCGAVEAVHAVLI